MTQAMADIIFELRCPLADMRRIILALNDARYLAKDIHQHVDAAIARARDMKRAL